MHILRQTAHVMVALDGLARYIQTFNPIGIDSPLCQPTRILYLLRLRVEYLHEVPTDNLAFLLGVGNVFEVAEEPLRCIHADYVQSQSFIIVHYIAELIKTQHTVIHKDARQPVAYRSVEQHCRHRRVHTARQA